VGLPHELLDGCFPLLLDSFPIEFVGLTLVAEITTPPTSLDRTLKSIRSNPISAVQITMEDFLTHSTVPVPFTLCSCFFLLFSSNIEAGSPPLLSLLPNTHAPSTTIFRATPTTSFKPRFTISYERRQSRFTLFGLLTTTPTFRRRNHRLHAKNCEQLHFLTIPLKRI
jgi:hypothetical protein